MRGSGRLRVGAALTIGVALVAAGGLYYLTLSSVGTLQIEVRDVPSSWLHLSVTFDRVEVHSAGAGNESGWMSVNLTVRSVDFLALGNLTKLLALDRIPAGTYTQLRIVVAQAVGMTDAGSRITMVIPDQGILKTDVPFTLPAGGTATLTLDFDLAHSVHQVQNEWFFQPVLGSVEVS